MLATADNSPHGPPAFPAALLGGIGTRLGAAPITTPATTTPTHTREVANHLYGHFSGIAAAVLEAKRSKRKRVVKPGQPPPPPPKVPIRVFCGTSSLFAAAMCDALRDFGAEFGVVFTAEYTGIGRAPAHHEDTWFPGVDGTLNMTPGNLRSWSNRIAPVELMFTNTARVALIECFLRAGGAAVIEITDPAAFLGALRRFTHYKIVKQDGVLYAICAGCRTPGVVGSAVYDALVDAVIQ